MRTVLPISPTSTIPRRGIATLEFAMALPFLLLLMVGITWLAYSVIGQSQVLIIAREKTWQQRFDDKAKSPLIFPTGSQAVNNLLYPGDKDYVSETATQTVHVSPVFDKAPPPKASNTVLAGSWDHRAMPFKTLPDWELIGKAGANGITGDLQSLINSALGAIPGLGGNFNTITDQLIGSLTNVLGAGSSSGSPTDKLDSAKAQSKTDQQQHQAADKQSWQKRLDDLGGKVDSSGNVVVTKPGGPLDQTIKEIERLEGQAKNSGNGTNNPTNDNNKNGGNNTDNKNGAKDDAQKKQDDANQRDLDLMKEKRKRLESDIRDADAELKAAS